MFLYGFEVNYCKFAFAPVSVYDRRKCLENVFKWKCCRRKLREIFMKKKIILAAAAAVIIIIISAAILIINSSISLEQAQSIALEHAGVSAEDAEFTKAKLDGFEYEIEFITPYGEYEYEISSLTGSIKDYNENVKKTKNGGAEDFSKAEKEAGKKTPESEASEGGEETGGNSKNVSKPITESEILSIACGHAGIKSEDILDSKIKLDDGVYEVEIKTSEYRYEYEISAEGEIIEFEKGRHYPERAKWRDD